MYAQKLTTKLTWSSLCHLVRTDEDYSDEITTAHSLQSCRRKIQFRQCSETALLHAVLDVVRVTACARYCWTQLLPVPVPVERSHCLCPLMLNAATACARYSWTQSPPLPVTVERIYFLAHYCWTQSLLVPVTVKSSHCLCPLHYKQSLPVPVTVERSKCLYARYCWTQSLPVPVTVEFSHCLHPLLHRYEQHLHSSGLHVVPHRLRFKHVLRVSGMIVASSCLSVNSAPTGWIFVKICVGSILKSLSWSFVFGKNHTRISDTLHEDRNTFMIISPYILSGRGGVLNSGCTENQNTHFISNAPDWTITKWPLSVTKTTAP
jgi:hypothetical protein